MILAAPSFGSSRSDSAYRSLQDHHRLIEMRLRNRQRKHEADHVAVDAAGESLPDLLSISMILN